MYDLYTGKRASIVSVYYDSIIIIMVILLLWTHGKAIQVIEVNYTPKNHSSVTNTTKWWIGML